MHIDTHAQYGVPRYHQITFWAGPAPVSILAVPSWIHADDKTGIFGFDALWGRSGPASILAHYLHHTLVSSCVGSCAGKLIMYVPDER